MKMYIIEDLFQGTLAQFEEAFRAQSQLTPDLLEKVDEHFLYRFAFENDAEVHEEWIH
jgi:hypothetical protein